MLAASLEEDAHRADVAVARGKPGATPPRAELEGVPTAATDAVAVAVADAIAEDTEGEDLFKGRENSPYNFKSDKDAEVQVIVLTEKVAKAHKLDVGNVAEQWVEKHSLKANQSPLENEVLKRILHLFFKEVKVCTKLTQYGTRFLLVLVGGENVFENISDIANLVNLYYRGEHVFFALSLGCVVSYTLIPVCFAMPSYSVNSCVSSTRLCAAGDRDLGFVRRRLLHWPRWLGLPLRVHNECAVRGAVSLCGRSKTVGRFFDDC